MDVENRVGTILIIDDEQSTLNMLRLLLTTYGYTVLTAESGEKGLDLFLDEEPGIILTDVRMPGMDGIEVLRQIKGHGANAEVIVVTGHGDMALAIQALQHGASDFINKPIQKQALLIAIKRANEKIELRKQLEDHTHNLERKIEAATAELARSNRQLTTLFEISRSMGEMATMREILDLLRDRVQVMTSLRWLGALLLDGTGNAIMESGCEPAGMILSADLPTIVKELGRERFLQVEERARFFSPSSEPEAEDIVLIPLAREGERPLGAVLIGARSSGAEEEEIRFVTLLLSIATGAIRRAASQEEEVKTLRRLIGEREQFGSLIGGHAAMSRIFRLIETVADSDATILIQGESGTGKELIARRVHELSGRRNGPFVVINCAAYPQTLLESELFGHEKGAFTGAIHSRKGSFEQANGGTIFLDEIGEISLTAQVKLLRVIQFKEFQKVGSETILKVDARLLAATSRNLRKEIEIGNFREDLFYRLHVIPIMVPPLRERMSDLPLLAGHFLQKMGERSNKRVLAIETDAMNILMNHRWPGNIRELENVIEHAFILANTDKIRVRDLPDYLREAGTPPRDGSEGLEEMEKKHLARVLDQCRGNKIQAARKLKISRSTLYRKLQQYQILD